MRLDKTVCTICNMTNICAKCDYMSKKPPILDPFCKNWNQNILGGLITKRKKEIKWN